MGSEMCIRDRVELAVTFAGAGMLLHSTVRSAGVPASVASSLVTVITCVASVAFPQLSVAVHVLVIVVVHPLTIDDSSNVMSTFASQLSVALG